MENINFEIQNNVRLIPLATLKTNTGQIEGVPPNPRTIKNKSFKWTKTSILVFPKMLYFNTIKVVGDFILAGNQRKDALIEIAKMSFEEVEKFLAGNEEFSKKSQEAKDWTINFWRWFFSQNPILVPVVDASEFTVDEMNEFIIKDNVHAGEFDWETIEFKWDKIDIENWGVEIPQKKNTEILSDLVYDPMYYEPVETPNIKLDDCLDLEKFNAKVKALDEYDLSKKQKDTLKMFAYRFIKIDFESVANYYQFNATEEEKKALERLRLVLTDNGVNGFIQDDLLRIYKMTDK